MTKGLESLLFEAARQAAIASWDAHGMFVSADEAYEFIRQRWEDIGAPALPFVRPAQFRHDYERLCGCIAEGDPFIMCDVTRPVA